MKYIDAELLKEKLDEHYRKYQSKYMETRTPYTQGLIDALDLAEQVIDSLQQEQPEVFDTAAFQKGVQEGRRLEREDVKSTIQSRIDENLGDAQPAPILRMELQELIKKIEL